jgi:hypothetical protein
LQLDLYLKFFSKAMLNNIPNDVVQIIDKYIRRDALKLVHIQIKRVTGVIKGIVIVLVVEFIAY